MSVDSTAINLCRQHSAIVGVSYSESQGIIGSYPITAVLVHEDQLIVDLIIDGESLTTTPEHPFYTLAGWEVAGW
jgi:intein/homing endonuclease